MNAASTRTIWAVSKLALRRLTPAYLITALCLLGNIIPNLVFLFDPDIDNDGGLSTGNILALLPLLAAIFIPTLQLRKIMNLGARRIDFFWGCVPVYTMLSAFVSLIMITWHSTIDAALVSSGRLSIILDMATAFGFYRYGPLVAFLQLTAFLILVCAAVHTLVLAQTAWYGWVADVVLVTIISVFTPIPPLRAAEAWFFNVIIFGNVWIQIISCLLLATALYALSKLVLDRKRM